MEKHTQNPPKCPQVNDLAAQKTRLIAKFDKLTSEQKRFVLSVIECVQKNDVKTLELMREAFAQNAPILAELEETIAHLNANKGGAA